MKEFLKSPKWQHLIRGDLLLYQAAYMSLDLTIDRLGRDEFQRQLQIFQGWNQRAQQHCAHRGISGCSNGGDPIPVRNRTCYVSSIGCYHACLDEIVEDPTIPTISPQIALP